MRTMTAGNAGYLSGRNAVARCPFDLGRQLRRFQRYVETSAWDEQLIRFAARYDRALVYVVAGLALAAAFSLSQSL